MFQSNGFEDMDTMMELQEEHLAQLNIPLGHRLKIVKAIKALNPTASSIDFSKDNSCHSQDSSNNATSFTKGGTTDNTGEYDEEKNKEEFQQALIEWRQAGKQANSAATQIKVTPEKAETQAKDKMPLRIRKEFEEKWDSSKSGKGLL